MNEQILSVICVLNNCGSAIEPQLSELIDMLNNYAKHYEIILVDDASTDNTVERVKFFMANKSKIRLLVLSEQCGNEIAYYAGLDNSIGDLAVLFNPAENPVSMIPKMVSLCVNDGYDLVLTKHCNNTNSSMAYRMLSSSFYAVLNKLTGKRIDKNHSYFTCMTQRVVSSITQVKDRIKFLKFAELQAGHKWTSLEYDVAPSSYCTRNIWRSVYTGFERMVATTEVILRGCALLSFVVSCANVLYIIYPFLSWIFNSNIQEGWTSASILQASMFAVLFFILAVQCEYISVIYKETKKGPLYHVIEDVDCSHYIGNLDKNVI